MRDVPWFLRRKLDAALVKLAEGDTAFTAVDLHPLLSGHFSSAKLVAVRQDHIVSLQGTLVVATPDVGETLFTLPLDFEPEADVVLSIPKISSAGDAQLNLDHETRVVTWAAGSGGTYTLSGLSIIDPWKNG